MARAMASWSAGEARFGGTPIEVGAADAGGEAVPGALVDLVGAPVGAARVDRAVVAAGLALAHAGEEGGHVAAHGGSGRRGRRHVDRRRGGGRRRGGRGRGAAVVVVRRTGPPWRRRGRRSTRHRLGGGAAGGGAGRHDQARVGCRRAHLGRLLGRGRTAVATEEVEGEQRQAGQRHHEGDDQPALGRATRWETGRCPSLGDRVGAMGREDDGRGRPVVVLRPEPSRAT